MKNKKVLVVLGGTSGEREVSLDSGRACIKALKKIGYSVSTFDPKKKPFNLIDQNKTDVIFNALIQALPLSRLTALSPDVPPNTTKTFLFFIANNLNLKF